MESSFSLLFNRSKDSEKPYNQIEHYYEQQIKCPESRLLWQRTLNNERQNNSQKIKCKNNWF